MCIVVEAVPSHPHILAFHTDISSDLRLRSCQYQVQPSKNLFFFGFFSSHVKLGLTYLALALVSESYVYLVANLVSLSVQRKKRHQSRT